MSKKTLNNEFKYTVKGGARMDDSSSPESMKNFRLQNPLKFMSLESIMVHFRKEDEDRNPFLLFPPTGKGWNVIVHNAGVRTLYTVEAK